MNNTMPTIADYGSPERLLTDYFRIDSGWARAMAPVAEDILAMGPVLQAKGAYFPHGSQILRAFTRPFDQVRVLVAGQDPYPTPGHAVGLSFSVAPGCEIPRSLQNIFTEYSHDLELPMPTSGDLTPWTDQGVCLLNRTLTVAPGAPASHRGIGWEKITEHAVTALAERGGPLVAILWGRQAQELTPLLGQTPIIASTHPSPLSAARGFFGSRPFSRANAALVGQGAEPIDWRLP